MPKPRPVTTTINYNVTALVVDGVIRLSGDIVNDIIDVTPGATATVTIADTADWILYAAVNSTSGVPGCWGRVSSGSTNTFNAVTSESFCIVYAVSRTSAKTVTYGPVITIKPKG
jgi:hypothetical protein